MVVSNWREALKIIAERKAIIRERFNFFANKFIDRLRKEKYRRWTKSDSKLVQKYTLHLIIRRVLGSVASFGAILYIFKKDIFDKIKAIQQKQHEEYLETLRKISREHLEQNRRNNELLISTILLLSKEFKQ